MTFEIRIRENEECAVDQLLFPDLIYSNEDGQFMADMAMTADGLDLLHQNPLHTAIIACLFTDKRQPEDQRVPGDTPDRRGWHGDTYDVREDFGERELGSLLWTLKARGTLDYETERLAEQYCHDALQTLIDQGAVTEVTVQATAEPTLGRLEIVIDPILSPLFDDPYSVRFALPWQQTLTAL